MAKKLRTKRAHLIKQLDQFELFINEYEADRLDELKLRLDRIMPLLGEVNDIHLEQMGLDAEKGNLEELDDEYQLFSNKYYRLVGNARRLLPVVRETVTPVSQISERTVVEPRIKLPTLNLPTFSGNYEHFSEFRDTFAALVHNNESLSNVQRFYYLRAALKGEATKVIQSLEASDLNYTVAWDLLQRRYQNLKLLVRGHIKAILDIPSIQREDGGRLRLITDTLTRSVRCLSALKIPVESWDLILIHIIGNKLDRESKRAWESVETDCELPKLSEFTDFLHKRCNMLETLHINDGKDRPAVRAQSFAITNEEPCCSMCKGKHALHECSVFKSAAVKERREFTERSRLCFKCFRENHSSKFCTSQPCAICNRAHNTLLHFEQPNVGRGSQRREARGQIYNARAAEPTVARGQSRTQNWRTRAANQTNTVEQPRLQGVAEPREAVGQGPDPHASAEPEAGTSFAGSATHISRALLSTAIIELRGIDNGYHACRVLLDSGSQSNFITKGMCDRVGLQLHDVRSSVNGIGNMKTEIEYRTTGTIRSRFGQFSRDLSFLVLRSMANDIPSVTFDKEILNIPNHIRLADDGFNKGGPIDMILGTNVFWDLLGSRKIKLGAGLPILQQTAVGWVIAGEWGHDNNVISNENTPSYCAILSDLAKFWEIEEVVGEKHLSADETTCEKHFKENTRRDPDGRFIVKIPVRENVANLGESRNQAVRQLLSTERRGAKNPELHTEYSKCMNDYILTGHMTEIDETRESINSTFYLPHHAVVKETSLTTKTRIVFNASAISNSGLSLNDVQFIGPVVQSDLFTILLRFRSYKFVISADIQQMYRQILIDESQRGLQRILWRERSEDKIRCYEMNRVTFGMASSPYLATRCLEQLAIDYEIEYPNACAAIREGFYVDDLLTGADTVPAAKQMRDEIVQILKTARFHLRKWAANHRELVDDFSCSMDSSKVLSLGDEITHKTLGLEWNGTSDTLRYRIAMVNTGVVTKRTMLSTISKIFDPLGLLAPCIISAKIMLQALWLEKIGWDEPLSEGLMRKWKVYITAMNSLNNIAIPRYVLSTCRESWELHGFSDASTVAYGCAIYVRVTDGNGIRTHLICSKSRVAPLKSLTVPRLELCGALLLTRLMRKVINAFKCHDVKCTLWCDSTVVLSWLKTSPHLLKVFVDNRVAEIQQIGFKADWRHVPTTENPADLLSRGVEPIELEGTDMWWHGPFWLSLEKDTWPPTEASSTDLSNLPELRAGTVTYTVVEEGTCELYERFSTLEKLTRVVALLRRFANNCRKKRKNLKSCAGYVTIEEFNAASQTLIKMAQAESFSQEIQDLKAGRELATTKLRVLSAYLDDNGIIRVGGRLQKSDLQFEAMHQVILSGKHTLTQLIARSEHRAQLHCGPQQLLYAMRQRYWPIAGRNLARKTVHNCVICFKAKPRITTPRMGELPRERVTVTQPFTHTGVDYSGAFSIVDKKTRGNKEIKCYACVFVCLSTKAVHLELASDLSTENFIAALRRFCARRGRPASIMSDNATNFVGAKNELNKFVRGLEHDESVQRWAVENRIEFKFIPARSPHFGGLWESAVRVMKYHLRRLSNSARFTYEEFATVLTQVEAVLNSRPLCPLSQNPNDLEPLSPAHFLIGRPMTSIADQQLKEVNIGRLSRYQLIQRTVQSAWIRFQREYLNELQGRKRWNKDNPSIQPGDLVVIQQENLPPCHWKLGRVVTAIKGTDGVVRVAEVKTAQGMCKRAVRRLCVLPIEAN